MADLQITQEITVDLDDRSPFEYVVVKQGDKNSRIVAVTLLQNKQVFTIPTGTTARIKYYKPDGNEVLNDCTISGIYRTDACSIRYRQRRNNADQRL